MSDEQHRDETAATTSIRPDDLRPKIHLSR